MTGTKITVDPIILGIFTILVLGIASKIIYDWFKSGRIKTGDYYVTTKACQNQRDHCCINAVKKELNLHKQAESYHDSEVNTRLSNIESQIAEAKTVSAKLREEAREDNAALRKDVGGIKSALDKITGVIEIYVQKANDRDRRTDIQYNRGKK